MSGAPSSQLEDGGRPPAASAGIGLVDLVRLIRRRWLVISAVPLALVVLVVLLEARAPRQYRAMATLVVVPPVFSSQLKPSEISIQGYQRILESDGVVIETLNRLVELDVLEESPMPRVGDQLTSRIFTSKRGTEKSLAPVLEVIAVAETPEKAALIANTWADVFLERTNRLVEVSLGASLRLIDTHYQEQTGLMAQLERDRAAKADEFQARMSELIDAWDRKLVAARSAWDQRVLAHREETTDLLAGFQERSRGEMDARAASLFSTLESEGSVQEVDRDLAAALRELVVLRTHLAQTPAVVALEKAITDDALWLSLSLENTPIEPDKLVTEESDPVHAELASRLSTAEMRVFGLMSSADEELREALVALEALQRARAAGLAKLKLTRAGELEELRQGKGLALRQIERQRAQRVSALERERGRVLAELDRGIEAAAQLHGQLAESANQASLAEGEGSLADVQIASRALPPLEAQPGTLLLRLMMGLVVGTILGLALALVLEASARIRAANGLA